ncbi:uncharacterized protein C6orf62 homolog isoform X4 [Pongo abelii]|uniref:uncharacterized protein C6orf62 homolog isoform X4 n=1 Tax=Pongo abelii TaxID=9601 RepID=UPI0023E8CFF3|nr:uncharacterized protein C6orf62 homolog isoform X2 [Pongo abelii]
MSENLRDPVSPVVRKKKSALFEVSEVIPVMTNNYEENILKGVRDSSYSLESSLELLQKDVVQLHAPRYQSMRRDVIGCTQEMDFILWPRNDIEKIVCLLFSRWKESDEPFRPVQAKFEFHHGDYEKQFLHVLSRKDKTGIVVNNPNQSVFLFIDRQHLQGLTLSPGWSTLAYGSWLTAALTSWAQVIYLSFLSGWTTDSKKQSYNLQVMQHLPLPATGTAHPLGSWHHRGSPPSLYARVEY